MRSERLLAVICAVVILSAIFAPAGAQPAGVITGRVITEDGGGVPNVKVVASQVGMGRRGAAPTRPPVATTDEDGNFRFTDLPPRFYVISISQVKGYAWNPISAWEGGRVRYYHIGDNVTVTLVKGGVITGRVTTAEGEPIVGSYVTPILVRDAEGNPVRQSFGGRWRLTDDRGIYRLFGLPPGTYLVSTTGSNPSSQTHYTQQIQTYHPSSTRETATEVTIANGSEVTGVDILLRNDHGPVVSGTITGGGEPSSSHMSGSVSLFNVVTGVPLYGGVYRAADGSNRFAIYGVPDGDYEIVAGRSEYGKEEGFASLPRRVTVKGADVTGIELRLLPTTSISGKVVVETSPGLCETKNRARREEVIISARGDGKSSISALYRSAFPSYEVDEKGEFKIPSLEAGSYHVEPLLPDENWYVRSITVPSAAPARGRAATAGIGTTSKITLKSGEKLTGLTMTVAEGAAGLRGKIAAEKEGAQLPSRLRLYLVPGELTAANDLLRYAETTARSDRTFEFKNLAPGKYWLVARAIPESEPVDLQPSPVAWDVGERAKLRREAEARKIEVELKPCQRASEQIVKF